jgi:hypothetical protein
MEIRAVCPLVECLCQSLDVRRRADWFIVRT